MCRHGRSGRGDAPGRSSRRRHRVDDRRVSRRPARPPRRRAGADRRRGGGGRVPAVARSERSGVDPHVGGRVAQERRRRGLVAVDRHRDRGHRRGASDVRPPPARLHAARVPPDRRRQSHHRARRRSARARARPHRGGGALPRDVRPLPPRSPGRMGRRGDARGRRTPGAGRRHRRRRYRAARRTELAAGRPRPRRCRTGDRAPAPPHRVGGVGGNAPPAHQADRRGGGPRRLRGAGGEHRPTARPGDAERAGPARAGVAGTDRGDRCGGGRRRARPLTRAAVTGAGVTGPGVVVDAHGTRHPAAPRDGVHRGRSPAPGAALDGAARDRARRPCAPRVPVGAPDLGCRRHRDVGRHRPAARPAAGSARLAALVHGDIGRSRRHGLRVAGRRAADDRARPGRRRRSALLPHDRERARRRPRLPRAAQVDRLRASCGERVPRPALPDDALVQLAHRGHGLHRSPSDGDPVRYGRRARRHAGRLLPGRTHFPRWTHRVDRRRADRGVLPEPVADRRGAVPRRLDGGAGRVHDPRRLPLERPPPVRAGDRARRAHRPDRADAGRRRVPDGAPRAAAHAPPTAAADAGSMEAGARHRGRLPRRARTVDGAQPGHLRGARSPLDERQRGARLREL